MNEPMLLLLITAAAIGIWLGRWTLSGRITRLVSEATLQKSIAEGRAFQLQEVLNRKTGENATLRQALTDRKEQMARTRTDLGKAQATIHELRMRAKDRREQEAVLKEENGAVRDALAACNEQVGRTRTDLGEAQATVQELRMRCDNLNRMAVETLNGLRREGALLPSAVRWADRLQEGLDDAIVQSLIQKPHPARAAAEHVRRAKADTRRAQQETELLRNRVDLYETQAPWLVDLAEYSLDEILAGVRLNDDLQRAFDEGQDPVRVFISPAEWTQLSASERSQRALDRYWSPERARSAWAAGIQYERYIGWRYEQDGYDVEYRGATKGKRDLGIDLVCRRGAEVLAVQCKRLSRAKQLPVRENVIAQLYGATEYYAWEEGADRKHVQPVIVTTFELSPEAREFARTLDIMVRENAGLEPYPTIKCNVSQVSGERIYHLPFDQQYDRTKVDPQRGECYAMTVRDAESQGFRRAHKWTGA